MSEPLTEPPGITSEGRWLIEERHPEEKSSLSVGTAPVSVRMGDVPQEPRDGSVGDLTRPQMAPGGGHGGGDPHDPELPAGGSGPTDRVSPQPESRDVLGAANSIATWEGLDSTGWIPPDSSVAIGDSDILQTANSGFAIYSRLGREIRGYTTFSSFLGNLVPDGVALSQPRVLYSTFHDQYAMLVLGRNATTQRSYAFIMISKTSSAEGDWWQWRVNVQGADGDSFMDSASLGGDTFGIYITGGMVRWTGSFKYAKLIAYTAEMWNGGTPSVATFVDLRWPGIPFTARHLQAAVPNSIAVGGETFFVNTFSGSGSSVLLWTLSGDRTNPTLTKATITGVPTYNALRSNVDQPGTSIDIDGGDTRIMNAVYSGRRVFFTLGSDPFDDGSRGSWITVKINVDNANVEWSHELWGVGEYYTFPTLALRGSSLGNVAVFGTWTAADRYPSAIFKIYDDQPDSSSGPFLTYQSGANRYVVFDQDGVNAWGSHSGAAFDASCGHVVGVAQWADALNSWSTQLRYMTFGTEAVCPMIDVYTPTADTPLIGGVPVAVRWNSRSLPAGDEIFVYYSPDGTSNWSTVAGPLPSTATSTTFTPPLFGSTSAGKIRVASQNGNFLRAEDYSDGDLTVAGCQDDAFENDDTCSGPLVRPPVTSEHQSCDPDWSRFIGVAGATYEIETLDLQGGSDTVLELSRSCGAVFASDDDGGDGAASFIEFTNTQAGAIDVVVRQSLDDYRAIESYTLSITCTACCDGSCSSGSIFESGFESGTLNDWSLP